MAVDDSEQQYHAYHKVNLLFISILKMLIISRQIWLLFYIGVELSLLPWRKNIYWDCSKTGCWGRYFDLRRRN